MPEYAKLKKCALIAHLNTDTSVVFLITAGSAFHSLRPATEKAFSLSKFCFGARYVELASLCRSEPTTARNRRDSNGCVCDVRWTDAIVDALHHQTELVANPICDRQPV